MSESLSIFLMLLAPQMSSLGGDEVTLGDDEVSLGGDEVHMVNILTTTVAIGPRVESSQPVAAVSHHVWQWTQRFTRGFP